MDQVPLHPKGWNDGEKVERKMRMKKDRERVRGEKRKESEEQRMKMKMRMKRIHPVLLWIEPLLAMPWQRGKLRNFSV